MKRLLILLLCLAMICTALPACGTQTAAPAASADQQSELATPTTLKGPTGKPLTEYKVSELDRKTLQDAIIQTALAYDYKDAKIQYDISNTTIYSTTMSGKRRLNCRISPEQAADDMNMYTSCSKYAFAIYHDAFDYEIPTYDTKWQTVYDLTPDCEVVVVKFGEDDGSTGETDRRTAIKALKDNIQVGDIIYASPKGDVNNGHTLVYLGDCLGDGQQYVIHSWPVGGGRLDKDTGVDKREPNGAITLQTLEECVLTDKGSPNYSIAKDKIDFFYLLRPFDAADFKDYKLTPSAVTRLEYPNLSIDKVADRTIYDDILPGEQMVLTETVENHSKTDYAELTLRELVPDGCTLVSAEGAAVNGNVLEWKLNLAAGAKQTVTYTVQNNLEAGRMLTIPSGACGMIPTRTMSYKVAAGRLTQEQKDAFSKTFSDKNTRDAALAKLTYQDLDTVNTIYREYFGIEAGLPATLGDYLNQRFDIAPPMGQEFKMLIAKTEPDAGNQKLFDMEINHSMTGTHLYTAGDSSGRIFDILQTYFQVGDVFITYKEDTVTTAIMQNMGIYCINIGGGRVLRIAPDGIAVENFSATVGTSLINTFFVALRPAMAAQ